MNILSKNILAKVALVGCLLTPLVSNAHEPVDLLHTTAVETVGTRLAYQIQRAAYFT